MSAGTGVPSLVCVVPAHQAGATLGPCLAGLAAAGAPPEAVIVVDDRSTDATAEIASAHGARVLRPSHGAGASAARNAGAAAAEADVICFVDADVVLHPGVISRIARAFAEDPALDAIFGSYDDAPPVRSFPSLYRNLLHHHVHQQAGGEARTFWTGCGAIRRARFVELGGFDPATENIEDVDLGMRLAARGGRIRLDPGLLGTHLKHWTLVGMLRTDFRGRAIPWSRLLLFREGLRDDLNTGASHRLNALLSAGTTGALVLALAMPGALWAAFLGMAAFTAGNARFFGLLWRRGSPAHAAAGVGLHMAHYLAAVAGFAVVAVGEALPARLSGRTGPAPRR